MKTKYRGVCLALAALLLASLFALSCLAGQAGYRNLLLATPSGFGSQGLSPERLDEFSKEEFPLTYELRQAASVQAVNERHAVTLVGTNHHYAGILGYVFLDGSFFTQDATKANSRHAVLNETAAFQIFGSSRISGSILKLNGETWLVVGVVRDGDVENARVYVPGGVTDGRADSVMVAMRGAVTEAYVKNALKSVGIQDSSYDFVNLSKAAGAFGERFWVALKIALSAVLLLLVLTAGGGLLESLRFYRGKLRELYFRELLARYRAHFLKTLTGLLLFAAGIGAMLALSLQILGTCLSWQELAPVTGAMAAGDFGHKLLWLRDYQTPGCVLFGACVGLILLCLVSALFRRARRKNEKLRSAYQFEGA